MTAKRARTVVLQKLRKLRMEGEALSKKRPLRNADVEALCNQAQDWSERTAQLLGTLLDSAEWLADLKRVFKPRTFVSGTHFMHQDNVPGAIKDRLALIDRAREGIELGVAKLDDKAASTSAGGIFVSHAHADAPVAEALQQFLAKLGVGGSVYCTSADGAGVPIGEAFVESIRSALASCRLFIALVSPRYMDSPFCLAEIGAAWALKAFIVPVFLPDVADEDTKFFLGAVQPLMLSDRRAAAKLVDAVKDKLGVEPRHALYESYRDDLIEEVNAALPQLGSSRRVARVELEGALSRLRVAEAARKALRQKLEAELAANEAARRGDDPKAARVAKLPRARQFEALITAARDALETVPSRPARRAILHSVGGVNFSPPYEEIEGAVKDGYIIAGDDGCYPARESDDAVDEAMRALEALEQYLAGAPEAVKADYKARHGFVPAMDNARFWHAEFGIRG